MDNEDRERLKRRVSWAIDQADDDEVSRMERDRGYAHDWLQDLIGWIVNLMSILASMFGGGGCFLTTAAVDFLGFPEDCAVLTSLRSFRDHYMLNPEFPRRAQVVSSYYRAAPRIVQAISRLEDAGSIWRQVYQKSVRVTSLIESARKEEAFDALIAGMEWMHRMHERTLANESVEAANRDCADGQVEPRASRYAASNEEKGRRESSECES